MTEITEPTTIRAIEIDPITGDFLADIPQHPEDETGPHIVTTLCPPGFHKPRWDGTQWVEGKAKADLDSLTREQKRARIYQRLDEKLRGATVTFNGEVYGADPRNASNITSLVSMGNSGRTLPAGFKLRTRDKQRVTTTKADLEALGEAMFNTVYPFYTGAWDKEDELDAAADPSLVDVETW